MNATIPVIGSRPPRRMGEWSEVCSNCQDECRVTFELNNGLKRWVSVCCEAAPMAIRQG